MSEPPARFEIHEAEEWAALYVDGELDRVGDAYLADERLRELVGCKTVQDDAFMRGQTARSGVAQTLSEVARFAKERDDKRRAACELRAEAARLLAQAGDIEARTP